MAAHDGNECAARTLLLREGELLGGRYRIERWLGGGGMASVYRAIHMGLGQPVAVKVLSPLVRELPGVVSRFMREARAATRLKGEHIVRVFDVGMSDGGSPYFVMEMLEGKDLAEMLEAGFCPRVDEAVDCVLQACEALAEIHGLGIVHRDLKPANVFITRGPDGLASVKLIDFGISRVDSPLSPEDTVALTSPEVVMGSPRYMPPEQMESAATADSRSDIWGLGAILYELLTGTAPFTGESLIDIYAAAMRSPPPPPSTLRKGIPRALDEVVLRCLRVEPGDRHADVAALALALAPFGDENAPARAGAIARVLDASRARGNGMLESSFGLRHGGRAPSSSRIRRRDSPPSRAVGQRRLAWLGGAALVVVVAVAAPAIARRRGPAPSPGSTPWTAPPSGPHLAGAKPTRSPTRSWLPAPRGSAPQTGARPPSEKTQ